MAAPGGLELAVLVDESVLPIPWRSSYGQGHGRQHYPSNDTAQDVADGARRVVGLLGRVSRRQRDAGLLRLSTARRRPREARCVALTSSRSAAAVGG